MAESSRGRHEAGYGATNPGRATACQRAVVRQRFGESHRDAGTDAGGQSYEESVPAFVSGEGGREDWRERRDRAIHESGQAGLNVLQDEEPMMRLLFEVLCLFGEVFFLVLPCSGGVLALFVGQRVEKFASGDIGSLAGRRV